MAKIIFRTNAGDTTVEAKNGETLLEVAERSGVSIFGGCGGDWGCCQPLKPSTATAKLLFLKQQL